MTLIHDAGWAWFQPPHATTDDPTLPHDADTEIARAFARTFAGPDGERAMAYLRAITMERALGPQAPDATLRHLEGQRQLVVHILGLTERGRNPNQGAQR